MTWLLLKIQIIAESLENNLQSTKWISSIDSFVCSKCTNIRDSPVHSSKSKLWDNWSLLKRAINSSAERSSIAYFIYVKTDCIFGVGISSPNSWAVSIHSCLIISTFCSASRSVSPPAIQPGNSGTSAINALVSWLQ